jgi:hypothetical protein
MLRTRPGGAAEASDDPIGTTEDPLAVTNDGWVSPHRGGTGGGAFQWDKCAPDEVVVAITQNRGEYVNTVGITCAKLAPNGSLGPDVPHYARGGRTDGQFFTMHCPAGSANWIDGEQAVCAFVDPTLPHRPPSNVVFHAL